MMRRAMARATAIGRSLRRPAPVTGPAGKGASLHSACRIAAGLAGITLAATPLQAQGFRGAIGYYGGGVESTDFNRSGETGGAVGVRLDRSWTAGAQVEYWLGGGRLGVRGGAGFSEAAPRLANESGPLGIVLNVYFADASLLLRLLPARADRALAPFLSAGVAGVRFDPGDDGGFVASDAEFVADYRTRPGAVLGIGVDLVSSDQTALRLEVSDLVTPESLMGPIADGEPFGPVHHIRATAGLHVGIGRLPEPAPRLIARAPEPPAEAARAEAAIVEAPAVAAAAAEPVEKAAPTPTPEALDLDEILAQLELRDREIAELRRRVAALERRIEERPAAAAPAPARTRGRLYTVQVGAFVDAKSVTDAGLVERIRRLSVPVWVSRAEVKGRTFTRVRVGALPSVAEAEEFGRFLTRQFKWPVWIAPVEATDAVPADAVPATRAFLGRS